MASLDYNVLLTWGAKSKFKFGVVIHFQQTTSIISEVAISTFTHVVKSYTKTHIHWGENQVIKCQTG